mgnify:CR=1 FL=1
MEEQTETVYARRKNRCGNILTSEACGLVAKVLCAVVLVAGLAVGGVFLVNKIGNAFKPITDAITAPFKAFNGAVDGIGKLGNLAGKEIPKLFRRSVPANVTTGTEQEMTDPCKHMKWYKVESYCHAIVEIVRSKEFEKGKLISVFYAYALMVGTQSVIFRTSELTVVSGMLYGVSSLLGSVMAGFHNLGLMACAGITLLTSDVFSLIVMTINMDFIDMTYSYRPNLGLMILLLTFHTIAGVPALIVTAFIPDTHISYVIPTCIVLGFGYGVRHSMIRMKWWISALLAIIHVLLVWSFKNISSHAPGMVTGMGFFMGIVCLVEAGVLSLILEGRRKEDKLLEEAYVTKAEEEMVEFEEIAESSDEETIFPNESEVLRKKKIIAEELLAENFVRRGLRDVRKVNIRRYHLLQKLDFKLLIFGILLVVVSCLPSTKGDCFDEHSTITNCANTTHKLKFRNVTLDEPLCVIDDVNYPLCLPGFEHVLLRHYQVEGRKQIEINGYKESHKCVDDGRLPCCVDQRHIVAVLNSTHIVDWTMVLTGPSMVVKQKGFKVKVPNLIGKCPETDNNNYTSFNDTHTFHLVDEYTINNPKTLELVRFYIPEMVLKRELCCGIESVGNDLEHENETVVSLEYFDSWLVVNDNKTINCSFEKQLLCLFSMRVLNTFEETSHLDVRRKRRSIPTLSWTRLLRRETVDKAAFNKFKQGRSKTVAGLNQIGRDPCSRFSGLRMISQNVYMCPDGTVIFVCVTDSTLPRATWESGDFSGNWEVCINGRGDSPLDCCVNANRMNGYSVNEVCAIQTDYLYQSYGPCPSENRILTEQLTNKVYELEGKTLDSLSLVQTQLKNQFDAQKLINTRVDNLQSEMRIAKGISEETRTLLFSVTSVIGNLSQSLPLRERKQKIEIGDLLNRQVAPLLFGLSEHVSPDPVGYPTKSNYEWAMRTGSLDPILPLGANLSSVSEVNKFVYLGRTEKGRKRHFEVKYVRGEKVHAYEYRTDCNYGRQLRTIVFYHEHTCYSTDIKFEVLKGLESDGYIPTKERFSDCHEKLLWSDVPCEIKLGIPLTGKIRTRRSVYKNLSKPVEHKIQDVEKDVESLKNESLTVKDRINTLAKVEEFLMKKDSDLNSTIYDFFKKIAQNETILDGYIKTMREEYKTRYDEIIKQLNKNTSNEENKKLLGEVRDKYQQMIDRFDEYGKKKGDHVQVTKSMYNAALGMAIFSTVISCISILLFGFIAYLFHVTWEHSDISVKDLKDRFKKFKDGYRKMKQEVGMTGTGIEMEAGDRDVAMYSHMLTLNPAQPREGKCMFWFSGQGLWVTSHYTYTMREVLVNYTNQLQITQTYSVNSEDPFDVLCLLIASNEPAFQKEWRMTAVPNGPKIDLFLWQITGEHRGEKRSLDSFLSLGNTLNRYKTLG